MISMLRSRDRSLGPLRPPPVTDPSSWHSRFSLARSASLLLLALHPYPNKLRAIAKHDAVPFARSQKAHGVAANENHVREIEHDGWTRRFCREQPPHFDYVLGLESTEQREHDVAICRAQNLEHRATLPTHEAIARPIATC